MSVWHELYKAKEHSQRIGDEISRLIKEHNGLTKREITSQKEKLQYELAESIAAIEAEYKELMKSVTDHKKALAAKSRFLKRHNENGFI